LSQTKKNPKNEDKAVEKTKRGNSILKNLKVSLTRENTKKNGDKKEKTSEKTPEKTRKSSESPKKSKNTHGKVPENPEEDPTIYMFKNFKEHEKLQALRKRKSTIIKITAITTSIILIIIGIIYSLTPDERVASNVIFGERAMFSVFLILVAFMILVAVFASKLLEGKYLKSIHQNLQMMEGKGKDEEKDSGTDPIVQRMNKKNK
jgi:hypothetical protein